MAKIHFQHHCPSLHVHMILQKWEHFELVLKKHFLLEMLKTFVLFNVFVETIIIFFSYLWIVFIFLMKHFFMFWFILFRWLHIVTLHQSILSTFPDRVGPLGASTCSRAPRACGSCLICLAGCGVDCQTGYVKRLSGPCERERARQKLADKSGFKHPHQVHVAPVLSTGLT